MRILLIVLLIASNLIVYAQEKVFHEQIGNKIGLKTYDSTKVYSPVVVFKGKELSLTSFEHAYFSPNRELVAIVTSDPELYYPKYKKISELQDSITIYDLYGNPVKIVTNKPVGKLAINNRGELIISEIQEIYSYRNALCNIHFYNKKGNRISSKSFNFINSPSMYFLNDSVVLVYGKYIQNTDNKSVDWVLPSESVLVIFVNFIETGEKTFTNKGFQSIVPSIPQKKPKLIGNLIKVFSKDCIYDSDKWMERTIGGSKCDSIILYINFNGEMIKKEEKW